jgi:hypothetical protein
VRIRLVVAGTFHFSIPSNIRHSLADWRSTKNKKIKLLRHFLSCHSTLGQRLNGSALNLLVLTRVRKPLIMHRRF